MNTYKNSLDDFLIARGRNKEHTRFRRYGLPRARAHNACVNCTSRDSTSISAGCSVDHELQHGNGVGWTAAATKLKGH